MSFRRFSLALPLNCAAICLMLHSPGVVRSRSRMAASCSLGFLGHFCCSTGSTMGSSSGMMPSMVGCVSTILASSGA